MTRGKQSGDEDNDSADQNEADGHQAKSPDRGGENLEEEPQVYPELHTRRAREQRVKGVDGGGSGDRAQGSGGIPCAAQCPTSLTHSPASHRQ